MTTMKLPFLHRFVGRTPRNDQIRTLSAWDTIDVEIPESHFAGFDLGANIGPGARTFSKDGEHWAYFDDGRLGASKPKQSLSDIDLGSLRWLMQEIGPSLFFDEGPMRVSPSETLSKTPPSRLIEHSQRERNADRISRYASENLSHVSGHLMVRVHEPSIVLNAWNRPKDKKCYLQLHAPRLAPMHSSWHNYGLHFSLDELDDALALGSSLVAPDKDCDELMVMMSKEQRDLLEAFEPSTEDMISRSLQAIALVFTNSHLRSLSAAPANHPLVAMSSLSLKPSCQMTEDDYARLLEAMKALKSKLDPAERLLLRLAEERWHDRPVNVSHLVMQPGLVRGA
ncbi:hypothetical protein OIU34_21900 [Pararhizobium sp. BT-229]|uniref:hypothetical protein n=1 Tax=Pararhizobium sp. BT-229 TaxID=2986923 RepID=UPI0021F6A293|nr:hypothetical protein [Pararhizobium sp. BT-229]MCV9964547.1 hypothetical protein [Pararhizobium sp. BT-229]